MPKRSERGIKKSAFSCEPCRRRKVKCGTQRPYCDRCLARGDECEYKLYVTEQNPTVQWLIHFSDPTLSYTERLESKVRDLQTLLEKATSSQGSSSDEKDHSRDETPSTCSERLTVDDYGRISFHGPTSIFNAPGAAHVNGEDVTLTACPPDGERAEKRREQLVTNAWVQRAAEAIAQEEGPFPSLLQYLLDFHWTWIQPIFNFVYRPAFTRDMKHFGPYYSHTLLSAILAHSIRWCRSDPHIMEALAPYEDGQLFSYHARTLLHADLQNGRCNIPTIQALLLISAQECGAGNCTQAWMYSGVAFRLAEDLGITIDARKYAGEVVLEDEDIEIRNRLFWSCYIWDKMISLYMGRRPLMACSDVSPPQVMTDDSTEYEIWKPHGLTLDVPGLYPVIHSHAASTFLWTCKLAEIIHQLLAEVYNPVKHATHDQNRACLIVQRERLREWWEKLPDYLRIVPEALPEHSPPNHIVTLNCLYHTAIILVHRSMIDKQSVFLDTVSSAEAFSKCLNSGSSICVILKLFFKSFGDGHCTMALAYSIYTAALVFLQRLDNHQPIEDAGQRGLDYCLTVLGDISNVHPVLGKPLRLLQQRLVKRQAEEFDFNAPIETLCYDGYQYAN